MKKLLVCVLLISLILTLASCGSIVMLYDDTGYAAGAKTFEETITAIEVEWPVGSVSICTHDGEDVIVEESGGDVKSMPLYHRVMAGRLSVKYAKSGVSHPGTSAKSLTVKLPRDYELSALEIDVASADAELAGVEALSAEIDSASGDVTLVGCSISGNAEISTASGNVTIKDTAVMVELEIDTASGNVDAQIKKECMLASVDTASGDVKLECDGTVAIEIDTASGDADLILNDTPSVINSDTASGDLSVVLPSDAKFSFTAKSASGDLRCEFEATKDGNRYTVGGGSTGYTFESASGDLEIRKGK